jgi:hypothetical protein
MSRSDIDVLRDNYEGVPLSYDDYYRTNDKICGHYSDGYFPDSFAIGDHQVSGVGRLEMMATEHGVEPVIHVGWANFIENTVRVKSADMPILDFFGLAEAVVSRDEQMGVECVHRIMQYEAPDIIDTDTVKNAVRNTKRMLEYGLLESSVWDQATEGRTVAILNPSIATLKRVLKIKGEKRVYFTETTGSGTEYYQELVKEMMVMGYSDTPIRCCFTLLPTEYAYYLGFSGGKDSRKECHHMFGFELNPYHPDALNGMMSGVSNTKQGVKYEIARGSYTRYEYYEDQPTYFRYYGDVVAPVLKRLKVGGEEAFNFVCSHEIQVFQRKETLLNEGDVLCDGFFFKDMISRQEKIKGYHCYIDTENRIVDIEKSYSYENRREEMVRAKFPLELAHPIHDSRLAKIAYLRYRSAVCVIKYSRPNEVKLVDQKQVSLTRLNVVYGYMKFGKFVKSVRDFATHIWTSEYGYRQLDDGCYPCDVDEFVQLLDESMLRAQIEPLTYEDGLEAIVKDGFTPYNCVSNHSGKWRTLEFCRIDVDYKSNFSLVEVFKSYSKFIGPFYKRSLVIAKGGIKRKDSIIDKESFQFFDGKMDLAIGVSNGGEDLIVDDGVDIH